MRHLRVYMARSRVTWALWMCFLTVPYTALFILQLLWEAVRNAYAMWHWQHKDAWKEWFSYFSESHRKATRTIAARPERTADVLRPPSETLQ